MAQAEPQKTPPPAPAFPVGWLVAQVFKRKRLADGNLGQANILHHGPHDALAACFGREGEGCK